ncbi:hypothetical protein BO71DRAFT_432859 [Aspergillus ellipticus CBS 707.79]|uniref:Pinin/SDK/MemA protein domain-containing protein n=1 Tax=Aspergillus ellipticus CBS 707.79 TaxID=1448320 RepID=A0A319D1S9_9EURO|nr:hypothetical protein BO71DRAFT_432859 [Aspergillus ellipticus CBS 707.79]
MTEGTLASAVLPPDQPDLTSPPAPKRRKSSLTDAPSDTESKRRRLSSHADSRHDYDYAATRRPSSPAVRGRAAPPRRPAGGRDEDRKRGQRLFGGLLGTLSQSSTSAAQKRRADIDRRQQDKLKLQDEEYGEVRRKRREERVLGRRREQVVFDEEVMRMRHANLLAEARFLKTRAEPVLYYKPWQLREAEEDIVQDQIREVEATVAREVEEFEARRRAAKEESKPEEEKPEMMQETQEEEQEPELEQEQEPEQAPVPESDAQGNKSVTQASSVTLGAETTVSEEAKPEAAPAQDSPVSFDHDRADIHRHDDDGGEVVEDQEDTVIY